jgi:hypothetical protein
VCGRWSLLELKGLMVLVKSFVGMDGVILSFEGDCLFLEKANL